MTQFIYFVVFVQKYVFEKSGPSSWSSYEFTLYSLKWSKLRRLLHLRKWYLLINNTKYKQDNMLSYLSDKYVNRITS